MGAAGQVALADLPGRRLGERTCSYTERDAILFALSVGARAAELRWVYERRLEVMPTFALTLGLWAVQSAGAIGAYDPVKTLHVGQELVMRRTLPAAAELTMESRIGAVWDKGSVALVEVKVESEFFDATYIIFVPGGGGFGGDRGPSQRASLDAAHARWHAVVDTMADQAALYRLTGDPHPVHIDPDVARANGFQRPILHGLCTLAVATKQVADTIGADLASLRRLSTRLTAPVYPGEQIALTIWESEEGVAFRAEAGAGVALDNGEAEF